MNCRDFERWLDHGRPPESDVAMRTHAGSCPACARAWAASEALETELAKPMAAAPADFTDRVLARIEPLVRVHLPSPVIPWWLRALVEPTAVLTLLLIAVMTTGWEALRSLVATFAVRGAAVANHAWIGAADAVSRTPWGALLASPEVALGLELSGLCLVLVAVPVLYRVSMRIASRAAGVR